MKEKLNVVVAPRLEFRIEGEKKELSFNSHPLSCRAQGFAWHLASMIATRTSIPCSVRQFAAQGGRVQQRARPQSRRLMTIPARATPQTDELEKISSSSPTTTTTTPPPPPPLAPTTSSSQQPAIGAPELSLLFTAFLWGSYAPALRFLFSLEEPPSPATLTAARAVVQAGLLLAVAGFSAAAAAASSSAAAPAAATAANPQQQQKLSPLARFMRTPSPSLLTAGAELGVWNLAASAFHAAGLSRTSATEAAFVVCATGLLTPLFAAVAGEKQGKRVWGGCGVALLGALALSLDKSGVFGDEVVVSAAAAATAATSSSSSSIPLSTSLAGDGFVLCAAAFYSAATFRLSVLAPVHASGESGTRNSPQALAAAKSAAFAVGALAWALSSGDGLFSSAAEGGLASLLPTTVSSSGNGETQNVSFTAPLVLAWAALGPGALAAVLQSRGQARVPAGRAQALFATVPLWSAALAGVALGERTGAAGWAGGLLIVAGGALAATAPREEEGEVEGGKVK